MLRLLIMFRAGSAPTLLLALALLGAAHHVHPALPLRIVGSRSMQAPVEGWITLFRLENPRTGVRTALYGSSLAAGELAERRADLAPLARPLEHGELALLAPGVRAVPVPIGSRHGHMLYLYMTSPGASPMAVDFARLALSRKGQALAHASGIQPLSPAQQRQALARLAVLSH